MSRFARVASTVVFLAVAVCVTMTASPAARQQPATSVKALVAAASKYVAQYQQEFAFLIADETYSQTRTDAGGHVQHRLTKSEFFLTYLPADDEWVAVRDVMEVDGTPVTAREELRPLLAKGGEIRGLISQVIARNARYNIGTTTRNFNEPTLPLLLVGAKRVRDVKFERRDVVRDGSTVLATLAFEERSRPTLVRGPEGSMPGKGEFLIEAGTGIVRETTFELDRAGVKVKLTTDYAFDEKLKLWLPSTFTERYEAANDKVFELILCEATYSNYRKFDVTARIK